VAAAERFRVFKLKVRARSGCYLRVRKPAQNWNAMDKPTVPEAELRERVLDAFRKLSTYDLIRAAYESGTIAPADADRYWHELAGTELERDAAPPRRGPGLVEGPGPAPIADKKTISTLRGPDDQHQQQEPAMGYSHRFSPVQVYRLAHPAGICVLAHARCPASKLTAPEPY
jgi:hypothetical protein